MLRELFRIPGLDLPIYSFGLMLVLGCWLAIQLAQFLAKRSGLNGEHFVNIGILALVSGVVGARASHVFENWSMYFGEGGQGFLSAINIRSGGLTYYGGVLLATPVCIAYGLWHKIPIARGMDIIAPCLLIGLGLGRVGCFLNGCCWGATCDAPWAVTFPYDSPAYDAHVEEGLVKPRPDALWIEADPLGKTRGHWATYEEVARNTELKPIAAAARSAPVHPTQLYSTVAALLLAGTLVAYFTLAPAPGRVFALMMMLEGLTRYTIETLRIEPAVMHLGGYGFSYSMVVGALLTLGGIVAWFAFGAADKRRRPPEQNDASASLAKSGDVDRMPALR
ncbi:prolipoprotein diacylglyceryl transferase [bacterium]|nr:MAG: prolipoprotein diacylglyceryl transferase [bacterium]